MKWRQLDGVPLQPHYNALDWEENLNVQRVYTLNQIRIQQEKQFRRCQKRFAFLF